MLKKIFFSIQGYKGSYSHQVVDELSKKNNFDYEIIENETFSEAFKSIKKYGLGLIPVENSTAGFVESVIDELNSDEFEIIGECFLDINHTLLVNKKVKNIKEIKRVYSHNQALLQTSIFLKNNNIKPIDFGDTAGGAKYIGEENIFNGGAIGSEILADIYDLKILKRKINNEKNNRTRFLLIRKKDNLKYFNNKIKLESLEKKTSLIFKIYDTPGSLYKALGVFADNDINLKALVSRPVKKESFSYKFYIEFDGDIKSKETNNALRGLKLLSENIIFLGSYNKIQL